MARKKDANYWSGEFSAFRKRAARWRKSADEAVDEYLAERGRQTANADTGDRVRLSLFHRNISTLKDYLHGNDPKIDVSRDHLDPRDESGRLAASLLERLIKADDRFLPAVQGALEDYLLSGAGWCRVLYRDNPEDCVVEHINWRDVRWSYARTWKEVDWVAFRAYLSRDEAEARFGKGKVKDCGLKFEKQRLVDDDGQKEGYDQTAEAKCEVWEIWCRSSRSVYWWAESADGLLDEKPDPLGLKGFYPCPMPLFANASTKRFMPVPTWVHHKHLYNEANELEARVMGLTRDVRNVGVFDKALGTELENAFGSQDTNGILVPVENAMAQASDGAVKRLIEWVPLDVTVQALQTITGLKREKVEEINDITGLNEIMRGGATDPRETATAAGLKTKMGSVSVQALQDAAAGFAGELAELKAEVVGRLFNEVSILKQSNARGLADADGGQLAEALALIRDPENQWRLNIRPESMAVMDVAEVRDERTAFLDAAAQFLKTAMEVGQQVPEIAPELGQLLQYGLAGFRGGDEVESVIDRIVAKLESKAANPQQQQSPEAIKAQAEQAKAQMTLQLEQLKQQGRAQELKAESANKMAEIQAETAAKGQQELTQSAAASKQAQVDADTDLENHKAKLEADYQHAQRMADIEVDKAARIAAAQARYAPDPAGGDE